MPPTPQRAAAWRSSGLVALAVQIALGGWTSSNYAAIACPDFPTCQRAWWPHSELPRTPSCCGTELNIDYEGGVLDEPPRASPSI